MWQLGTGKKKQDVIVCDSSGTVKVTLWEENIDTLEQQASYCLQNFAVREFGSSKYLGMQRSRVIPNGDIGEVRQADEESGCSEILNPATIGVWHSQDLSEMQCESRAIHLNTGKMHEVRVCDVATVRHLCRSTICKDALHGRLEDPFTECVWQSCQKFGDDTAVTEDLMKLPHLQHQTCHHQRFGFPSSPPKSFEY